MVGRRAPNVPIATAAPPPDDYYGETPRGYFIGEMWRKAMPYPEYVGSGGTYPEYVFTDFPIRSQDPAPPIENVGIFLVNRYGAVVQVPDDLVTEDGEGNVYVRGIGVFSYATDQQILDWQEVYEPS